MSANKADCIFFAENRCTKGDKCEFRHSEASKYATSDCRFWLAGACNKADCPFWHDAQVKPLPQASPSTPGQIPCYYFSIGQCRNGDKCTFLHVTGTNKDSGGSDGQKVEGTAESEGGQGPTEVNNEQQQSKASNGQSEGPAGEKPGAPNGRDFNSRPFQGGRGPGRGPRGGERGPSMSGRGGWPGPRGGGPGGPRGPPPPMPFGGPMMPWAFNGPVPPFLPPPSPHMMPAVRPPWFPPGPGRGIPPRPGPGMGPSPGWDGPWMGPDGPRPDGVRRNEGPGSGRRGYMAEDRDRQLDMKGDRDTDQDRRRVGRRPRPGPDNQEGGSDREAGERSPKRQVRAKQAAVMTKSAPQGLEAAKAKGENRAKAQAKGGRGDVPIGNAGAKSGIIDLSKKGAKRRVSVLERLGDKSAPSAGGAVLKEVPLAPAKQLPKKRRLGGESPLPAATGADAGAPSPPVKVAKPTAAAKERPAEKKAAGGADFKILTFEEIMAQKRAKQQAHSGTTPPVEASVLTKGPQAPKASPLASVKVPAVTKAKAVGAPPRQLQKLPAKAPPKAPVASTVPLTKQAAPPAPANSSKAEDERHVVPPVTISEEKYQNDMPPASAIEEAGKAADEDSDDLDADFGEDEIAAGVAADDEEDDFDKELRQYEALVEGSL